MLSGILVFKNVFSMLIQSLQDWIPMVLFRFGSFATLQNMLTVCMLRYVASCLGLYQHTYQLLSGYITSES